MTDGRSITPALEAHRMALRGRSYSPVQEVIIGRLHLHGPQSVEKIAEDMLLTRQGVGKAMSTLEARGEVRVHEYGMGAACVWGLTDA